MHNDRIIGYRKDGRPILAIMGASPDDPSNNAGTEPEPAADPPAAAPAKDAGDAAADLEAQLAAAKKVNSDLERKLKRSDDNRDRVAELEAQVAKFEGREKEYQAAQERAKVEAEALTKANGRILKAEVRAVATGKLNDPQDALRFLDLSEFEVGSDGEVDTARVKAAIDDLIADKPYLAAQGSRFQGNGDGGVRPDKPARPQNLGEAVAREYDNK